jgi:uncharacterized protein (TIGR02145 family)
MKKGFEFYIFLLISFLLLFIPGCVILRTPSLSTTAVTDIGPTSATSGGNVTSDGNADILVRGVCWDTRKSPNTEDTRTTDGYGTGSFTSSLTELTPNTLYYVRAYAINSEGTSYGNQITFTTSLYSVPTLTTTAVSGITQTTAVSGGNITNGGGVDVTARGVCWSTHTVPTIADSKTSNGTGEGTFTSNMTGLTGNTKYYVSAYATNSEGTGYGQELSFTTSPLLPVVTTADPVATSTTTGTGGGTVTSDGGSAVTARGVCWNTSANPTTANSKTTDGTGTGTFTSNITGLTANTTFHVRAYATNSVGTAYGTDKTFTTDPITVTDNDGNTYNVIRIGTQLWMKENLKTTIFNDDGPIAPVSGTAAWANLTSHGYCWYNNDAGNKNTYGALYNWYAVATGKLCPVGWHVPTDDDCIELEDYFGFSVPAGGKLKETGTTHWASPNTGATDEVGFKALPGGLRTETGTFQFITNYGYWWTSTEYNTHNEWYRELEYNSDNVVRYFKDDNNGMSVRCIKD